MPVVVSPGGPTTEAGGSGGSRLVVEARRESRVCYRRICRFPRLSAGPLLTHRAAASSPHDRIPTNQSADFSDGRLRLAEFDLAKSLIKWIPIGDYTALTPFAP